jgi:hypothetical protein
LYLRHGGVHNLALNAEEMAKLAALEKGAPIPAPSKSL